MKEMVKSKSQFTEHKHANAAQLFFCIECNADRDVTVQGIETIADYGLSLEQCLWSEERKRGGVLCVALSRALCKAETECEEASGRGKTEEHPDKST